MRGYWKRPEDTFKTLDPEGWLSTGDQADILPGNYLKIKGRIKEIIVTSTGEKVPPVDIEQAIETDPLFDQAMVYGTIVRLSWVSWYSTKTTSNVLPVL